MDDPEPAVVRGGRNIVLVGFMATGKTSVGRRLAERVGYAFVDVDDLIEAEAGKPIPRIFEEQGEPAFRTLEVRMIEKATRTCRTVIATGGGAVVNPANMRSLKTCGIVIALTADPETILARAGTGAGASRPMLRGDAKARICSLLAERAPAYAQADVTLDTSRATVDEIADAILHLSPPPRMNPEDCD